jgi:hypothetical protein
VATASLGATTSVAGAAQWTGQGAAMLHAFTTVTALLRTNWIPRPGTPVVVETVHAEAPALVGV